MMEWKTYTVSTFQNFYDESVYFKTRFTQSVDNYAYTFTSDAGFNDSIKSQYLYGYPWGLRCTALSNSAEFSTWTNSGEYPPMNPLDFAEMQNDNLTLFAFRDRNTPANYLINAFFDTESEDTIVLAAGSATDGTYYGAFVDKELNSSLNYNIVDTNITNNSFGSDYVIQPLCVFNTQTPFYFVLGSTTLNPFVEFTANGKKFMTISKGICVEIPKE